MEDGRTLVARMESALKVYEDAVKMFTESQERFNKTLDAFAVGHSLAISSLIDLLIDRDVIAREEVHTYLLQALESLPGEENELARRSLSHVLHRARTRGQKSN